ncbi:MAG: DUF2807 domain-containing protein [Bacteroidota bacterium]
MKTNVAFIFTMIMVMTFSGIAQNRERRMVSGFDEVAVWGNIVLHLIPDGKETLSLASRRENTRNILTEIKGNKLVIKMRAGIYEYKQVDAYLHYKSLSKIKAHAGARVTSDDVLTSRRIAISAGSGARIALEIDTDAVSLSAGEGAECEVWGNSQFTEATAKTGGMLYADDLNSKEVYVRIHTGGEACVYAEDSIEGKVGTGGSLDILGHPERDYVTTNLGGQVRSKR